MAPELSHPTGGAASLIQRGSEQPRMHELLGLCRRVVESGTVSNADAHLLNCWIHANRDLADSWPASEVARGLRRFFLDSPGDQTRRAELRSLLMRIDRG